jgi:hypothetical protein
MPSAKSSSSGKRKTAAPTTANSKNGKGADPASVIEGFDTAYGREMFSEEDIFQLTPAESGHCGMVIQNQQWFLDNADSFGLKDEFSFTQAFVDGLQKDEDKIRKQGDNVEHASLKVFVNLIDAVGKFCNFDNRFDTKWELGVVLGSKCSSLTKVDQAAGHFMLHMRNHFLDDASDQRKNGGSALALVVSLYGRMKRDHKQARSRRRSS